MPTYYFDVHIGSEAVKDSCGDVFAGISDVADQAAGLLVDFAREALPHNQVHDFGVAVRNEAGQDVYCAALIFRDFYPDPDRPKDSRNACSVLSISNPTELIRQSLEVRAASKRITDHLRSTAIGLADAMRQAAEAVQLARTTLAAMG